MKRRNKLEYALLFGLLTIIQFAGLLYIFFPSLHTWGKIDIWGMGPVKISLYLFVIIFSFSFFVFFKNKPLGKKYFSSFVQTGIFISTLAILASYLLIGIEGQRYPNYLYSLIHLDKRSLPEYLNLQYFLIAIFLMGILKLETLIKGRQILKVRKSLQKITSPSFLLALFSVVLIFNVLKGFKGSIQAEINYYGINGNSFDERGKVVDLPEFWKQTSFIAAYTSRDSVIVHPLSTNHYLLGSQVMLRYFLYPRFLVSSPRLSDYEKEGHSIDNAYYILTKHHTEDKYYPEENFLASSIIVLYKDGKILKHSDVYYNQEFARRLGKFEVGLIQKQ